VYGPETVLGRYGSFYEIMEDAQITSSGVKPVTHFKASSALERPKPIKQWWGSFFATYYGGVEACFPAFNDSLLPLCPSLANSPKEDFGLEAYTSFVDQFQPQVDIINFSLGFETSQLLGLIPKIESSLTRTAAGAFLGWKFGIKPMISDLRSLHGSMAYLAKRLAWLRSTYGQRTRLGFQREFSLPVSDVVFYADTNEPASFIKLTPVAQRSTFRAGGFLTHRLQGLDSVVADSLALSAVLGLTNPLAVVWEAIPFSFVVDWFTKVSKMAATLQVQPFQGEYNVEGMTHSMNSSVTYRLLQGQKYPSVQVNDLGPLVLERYERFPGLPVPSSIFGTGELTPTQQMLALALIRQRI
jgi:hypothetical protein